MPCRPAPSESPDPALSLRRDMLVSSLFKYVAEIQELDDGYAFKFRRTEVVIRRIADYIAFEGPQSPQLTFVLVAEAEGGVLWLQVRGSESKKPEIRTAYPIIKLGLGSPA